MNFEVTQSQNSDKTPLVSIAMGSVSDGDIAEKAMAVLEQFGVYYEVGVKSAHRTPQHMLDYAKGVADRGIKVVIAMAGGSAHLPGMVASDTSVPVLAVPIKRFERGHGDEALKSSIAMPPGIPLATFGNNAADRAALFAVRILSLSDTVLQKRYVASQEALTTKVAAQDTEIAKNGWQSVSGS